MRLRVRFVLIVLCCVFAHQYAADAKCQYLHPKLKEKKVTIRSAAILPAKVEIVKEGAKGSEMMVAESADISTKTVEAVNQALQKKKINVVANSFEPASLDDARKYTLADIQSRYDALLPKLTKKSKDIKKARFTLGDEVMLLNVHKDADVLVFIRGAGRVFTKGKTAFSILSFNLDFPTAQITIGIVDAQSGEGLEFTKLAAESKPLKDERSLNRIIEKALQKVPAYTP